MSDSAGYLAPFSPASVPSVSAPFKKFSGVGGWRLSSLALVAPFVLTVLVSSVLMFLIEPMFARMVLPLLGGAPAVWNTCLAFFQLCLLAGYAYAHASIRWLGPRRQAWVQLSVLLVALLALPVGIPHGWEPRGEGNPIGWLALLLVIAVGLPFFAVSTTAPVVQSWFAATNHRSAANPYFLYAASNLGSMLALLAYPLLIEPRFRLATQSTLWSAGFGLLILTTGICALFTRVPAADRAPAAASEPIAFSRRVRWVLLAFVPASQLLGVTTFITSDIASVPLFWVVPLALYLLSFILVFSNHRILPHRAMVRLLAVALLGTGYLMLGLVAQPIGLVLGMHLAALFFASMVCHGELAKDRPSAHRLTDFYLMMSLGGVLGGLFNALLAPLIFPGGGEYPLILVIAATFCVKPQPKNRSRALWIWLAPIAAAISAFWFVRTFPPSDHWSHTSLRMLALGVPILIGVAAIGRRWPFAATLAAVLLAASAGGLHGSKLLAVRRSFFGIHRVVLNASGPFHDLYHGTTVHGRQRVADDDITPTDPQTPLTYYHRSGPLGELMTQPGVLPAHARIAAVGLGAGSVCAYAGAGTDLVFYEIDPAVRWMAERSGYFSFISAARNRGANVEIVLGDARLTLQQRADRSANLIILDAFSGDAIPVHLLTREAMQIYLSKLEDHGLLAIHVSNMYLNLLPLAAALTADARCAGIYRNDLDVSPEQLAQGKFASQWVIIARSQKDLEKLIATGHWTDLSGIPPLPVWTDDYSNLLSVFRTR